jgi:hypothetical protein
LKVSDQPGLQHSETLSQKQNTNKQQQNPPNKQKPKAKQQRNPAKIGLGGMYLYP